MLDVFIRLTFAVGSDKILCSCDMGTMKCLDLLLKSHLASRRSCFASLQLQLDFIYLFLISAHGIFCVELIWSRSVWSYG